MEGWHHNGMKISIVMRKQICLGAAELIWFCNDSLSCSTMQILSPIHSKHVAKAKLCVQVLLQLVSYASQQFKMRRKPWVHLFVSGLLCCTTQRKLGRPDMTSTADSLTLEVLLCNDYRSEGWTSIHELQMYFTRTFQFTWSKDFCCANYILQCPYYIILSIPH